MKSTDIKKLVNYWKATAEHDYETMLVLFKSKRYSDSLFFAHIVLEKILKAHVVKNTKKQALKIHDLVRLQELAKMELTDENVELLNEINDFNIRARYPEYKLQFYKMCTRKYASKYLDESKKLYKELCQKLKLKK